MTSRRPAAHRESRPARGARRGAARANDNQARQSVDSVRVPGDEPGSWGPGHGIGRVVTVSQAAWRTQLVSDPDRLVSYLRATNPAALVGSGRALRIDLGPVYETAETVEFPTFEVLEVGVLD